MEGPSLTLSVRNTEFVDQADHLKYLIETHTQVKAVLDALSSPGVRVECYHDEEKQSGDVSRLHLAMLSLLISLTNDIRMHPLWPHQRHLYAPSVQAREEVGV